MNRQRVWPSELQARWLTESGRRVHAAVVDNLRCGVPTESFREDGTDMQESFQIWCDTLAEWGEQDEEVPRVDLRGIDLRGVSLVEARLGMAWLSFANLNGCQLDRAKLAFSSLKGADLRRVSAVGANFDQSYAARARLDDADLTESRWMHSNLHTISFHNARLGSAVLQNAHMRAADLRGADMRGADLRGVSAAGALFDGARLDPDLHLDDLTRCPFPQYPSFETFFEPSALYLRLKGMRISTRELAYLRRANRISQDLVAETEALMQDGWRPQLVAAASLIHGPVADARLIQGLWEAMESSWAAPQLVVAARLVDEQFLERAERILRDADHFHPKLTSAIAGLYAEHPGASESVVQLIQSEAFHDRNHPDFREGRSLASRWLKRWREIAPPAVQAGWVG